MRRPASRRIGTTATSRTAAPSIQAARLIQKAAEIERTTTPLDRPHMNCSRLTLSPRL